MLKENLVILRNIHGYSQEEIAEKINISRQGIRQVGDRRDRARY